MNRAAALALLCLAAAAPRPAAAAIYDIAVGGATLGVSSLDWRAHQTGRVAYSSTELPGALVQHDQLQLDAAGWPQRYALQALVQGHTTRLQLRRQGSELIETVIQNGHRSEQRYASATPVDLIDNNSLAGWQAWLDRLHGRLAAGAAFKVFIPQARSFGRLQVASVTTVSRVFDGATQTLRRVQLKLQVHRQQVPVTLWLQPDSSHLLQFAQTRNAVRMRQRPATAGTAPAASPRCGRDVTLTTHRDGDARSAALTLPGRGAGRFPTLLLLPAQFQPDASDGALAPMSSSALYAQLADALACQGVATLRDLGPSAASVQQAAGDVAHWLNVLAHQPQVDNARLLLAGHGSGGLAALYALNGLQPQPAGVVLLDAPGQPLADVLRARRLAPARALSAGTAQRKRLAASVDQLLAAVRDGHGPTLTLPDDLQHDARAQRLAARAGLLRSELPLDPVKLAARLRIPLLVVQGSKDLQVLPANAARLQNAAPAATRLDYPDMTHTLAASPLPALSADFTVPGSAIEPKLAPDIAAWIRRLPGPRP